MVAVDEVERPLENALVGTAEQGVEEEERWANGSFVSRET